MIDYLLWTLVGFAIACWGALMCAVGWAWLAHTALQPPKPGQTRDT